MQPLRDASGQVGVSRSQCRGSRSLYPNHSGMLGAGGTASGAQRGAGVLHQMAELHAGRARRLAAPALHALVHRAEERVIDRRAAPTGRHASQRCDHAVTRSRGPSPGRRAGREAQTARDAGDELVLIELEGRRRVPACSQREPPGCELARRIEGILDPAHERRGSGAGRPKASRPWRPASRTSSRSTRERGHARDDAPPSRPRRGRSDSELRAPAHIVA